MDKKKEITSTLYSIIFSKNTGIKKVFFIQKFYQKFARYMIKFFPNNVLEKNNIVETSTQFIKQFIFILTKKLLKARLIKNQLKIIFNSQVLTLPSLFSIFIRFFRINIIKILKHRINPASKKKNSYKIYIKAKQDYFLYSIVSPKENVLEHRRVEVNRQRFTITKMITSRRLKFSFNNFLESVLRNLKKKKIFSNIDVYIKTKIPSRAKLIWQKINILDKSLSLYEKNKLKSSINFIKIKLNPSFNGCTQPKRKRKRFRVYKKIRLKLTNNTLLKGKKEKIENLLINRHGGNYLDGQDTQHKKLEQNSENFEKKSLNSNHPKKKHKLDLKPDKQFKKISLISPKLVINQKKLINRQLKNLKKKYSALEPKKLSSKKKKINACKTTINKSKSEKTKPNKTSFKLQKIDKGKTCKTIVDKSKNNKFNKTSFKSLTKNKMNRHKTTIDKNNNRVIVQKNKAKTLKTIADKSKKDKLNNTPFNPLTKNKMNRHKTTTDKNNSRIIVSKDKKNEIKTNEQVIDKNNLSKGAKKIKNLIDRSRVSHPKCYKDKKSLYKTNKNEKQSGKKGRSWFNKKNKVHSTKGQKKKKNFRNRSYKNPGNNSFYPEGYE